MNSDFINMFESKNEIRKKKLSYLQKKNEN